MSNILSDRPQIFGWQHLTYLAVFLTLGITSLILAKVFLKNKKGQAIYIKSLAGLTFITCVLCRIGVAIQHQSINSFFPYTICSMTSMVFSLVVIFGKENLKVYQAFWYIALVGGLGSMIYADFIPQNESFFYLNTIMGLLHHSFIFIMVIAMWMFNWFRPDFKRFYYFPMIFSGYITAGAFAQHVLKIDGSMLITKSVISGTPVNCWFILGVGTVLIALFSLGYELIVRWKNKKANKTPVISQEEN